MTVTMTYVFFSDEVETRSWCWVSSCRCSLTFSHSWRFPTRPISMKPRIQHLLIQTGFSKAFYQMIFSSNQSGYFNFLSFSGYLSSSLPFYLASLMPASTHKWVGNDMIQLFENIFICLKILQITSILGGVFKEQSSSAFAIFKFMQSLSAAIAFFYSPYLRY